MKIVYGWPANSLVFNDIRSRQQLKPFQEELVNYYYIFVLCDRSEPERGGKINVATVNQNYWTIKQWLNFTHQSIFDLFLLFPNFSIAWTVSNDLLFQICCCVESVLTRTDNWRQFTKIAKHFCAGRKIRKTAKKIVDPLNEKFINLWSSIKIAFGSEKTSLKMDLGL